MKAIQVTCNACGESMVRYLREDVNLCDEDILRLPKVAARMMAQSKLDANRGASPR